MQQVPIRTIDGTKAVVLSQEMSERLHVQDGDMVTVVETPDGLLLKPAEPDVRDALREGRRFMDDYAETLSALSKR